MKHIKLFENWKDKIEDNLAFPSGDSEEKFKYVDEAHGLAYRYRSLLNDRDFSSSLLQIKEMNRNGDLRKIKPVFGFDNSTTLFYLALERDRIDVCDYLHNRGYRLVDVAEVRKFLTGKKISDDALYAIKDYV